VYKYNAVFAHDKILTNWYLMKMLCLLYTMVQLWVYKNLH